jgi:hypothetical protein
MVNMSASALPTGLSALTPARMLLVGFFSSFVEEILDRDVRVACQAVVAARLTAERPAGADLDRDVRD